MGRRIVLADDEADLRRLLKARLKSSGFEVADAPDGRQALELVRTLRPDLVVLDQRMPEMDGTDVCRAIKSDAALRGTPVVIVTATSKALNLDEHTTLHPDDVVVKPFHYPDLLARIEGLLPKTENT